MSYCWGSRSGQRRPQGMKQRSENDQSMIDRRIARRRFCALATLAVLAVPLFSTSVLSQASSVATSVLRDAQILSDGSGASLADNHVAHLRRPASVAGGYAVSGSPASEADPLPAGPTGGQAPVAAAPPSTAVAPAVPSSPTATPPPAGEPATPPVEPQPTPPPKSPPPPKSEPPAPKPEPTPPPKTEPEPPKVEPGEPEPPSTPTGDPIFEGAEIDDFEVIQAAPRAITEVPDPLGSGDTVLKMTVDDSDVAPITPTDNPRAQALSPDVIEAGDEFWLKTKFMLPQDFPAVTGWMSLVEIFGPPFSGSSPWGIGVEGNKFSWMRNRSYGYDVPWEMPLQKGVWVDLLLHERFATDGWVEMWIDGQPVTFFPGKSTATQRLAMQTMDSSNSGGPNSAKIMQYREAGMFDTGTVYFGALSLGESRESVEG
ncbi:MAG: hypothetical protein QOE56_998 [Solirubrobacterales bacterium]|nr:hypothetical protein [Solirubrobacterales bacterium]